MGKKRITRQTSAELVQEIERVEQNIQKDETGTPQPVAQKKSKEGRLHIYSSYNNTIMTLTDDRGEVFSTASAGSIGFKGSKKSTPFAASKVADVIAGNAKSKGIERISVFVRGVGPGRESALRSMGSKGFEIIKIQDITPVPHNGPRSPKVRRV